MTSPCSRRGTPRRRLASAASCPAAGPRTRASTRRWPNASTSRRSSSERLNTTSSTTASTSCPSPIQAWSQRRSSRRSTASPRPGSCRSTSSTTTARISLRSVMPIDTPALTTRPRSITGSTPRRSRSLRVRARTLPSSDASTRKREWSRRSRPLGPRTSRSASPGSSRTSSTSRTKSCPASTATESQFIGPVAADDRSAFLGGAVALLHLIGFDEPFGFSVAEAMACGTPVIAFDRGSMSELIRDGVTGSLVADVPAAIAAVSHVSQFDRQTVRDVAVQRFSIDRMVDAYVAVYRTALAEHARRSPARPTDVASDPARPRR